MAKGKMTKRVILKPDELQNLKDAILNNESPKSIHERLGVSIPNIHYHKASLKKNGLLNPISVNSNRTSKNKSLIAPSTDGIIQNKEIAHKKKTLKLIVNGVTVHIDDAASVSVGDGFINIDF